MLRPTPESFNIVLGSLLSVGYLSANLLIVFLIKFLSSLFCIWPISWAKFSVPDLGGCNI
jgi:hypothetical protein